MYVNIFFFCFSNSKIISKTGMPVLLFLMVSIFMVTYISQFLRTKYKSKINKAMLMHSLIMTLIRLTNVRISVLCSDNASLSMIKIL